MFCEPDPPPQPRTRMAQPGQAPERRRRGLTERVQVDATRGSSRGTAVGPAGTDGSARAPSDPRGRGGWAGRRAGASRRGRRRGSLVRGTPSGALAPCGKNRSIVHSGNGEPAAYVCRGCPSAEVYACRPHRRSGRRPRHPSVIQAPHSAYLSTLVPPGGSGSRAMELSGVLLWVGPAPGKPPDPPEALHRITPKIDRFLRVEPPACLRSRTLQDISQDGYPPQPDVRSAIDSTWAVCGNMSTTPAD
jgi:hypothetical protein